MKNPIRSLVLGIALFGAASAVLAQSSTITYNATGVSLSQNYNAGGNFTFQKFDQTLGTLTAVDLILNSATGSGSASITSNDVSSATVNSLQMQVRTVVSVPGILLTQNSPYSSLSVTPSLPTSLAGGATLNVSASSQSILSSAVTYSVTYNSDFQSAGGSGSTPVFSSRFGARFLGTFDPDFTPSTNFSALSGTANYSLRYTYTPASPSPVPETGQVAASLLLLGGIGGYIFIKRRRAATPAAA